MRRGNDEDVKCREIADKKGTSGHRVNLTANYFMLNRKPEWCMYQYRVDFNPEIASKRIRIAMVKGQTSIVGNTSAFDGQTLYLPFKLPDEVTTYAAQRRHDDVTVQVTIKRTNELPPADRQTIQMFNVIFRRDLNIIGMNQIGRHYFNPELKIEIPRHSVEIWPGYATSIAEYENGNVLLCADVSHKILRTKNVLSVLYEMSQRGGAFQEEAIKALVGEIVLTKYNNKTYRIDDIDWDMNPLSTFPKRDGTEISIRDYYKKQHDLKVEDEGQPMLVSRPKARDKKAGQTEPFKLVPEFCLLTGMSDRMKADFTIMKDVAVHTRIGPSDRADRLNGLVRQLSANADVQKEMKGWGLEFAQSLLKLQGRTLEPEKIFQRDTSYSYNPQQADWSTAMRGKAMISTVNLDRWIILCTQKDSGVAEALCNTMQQRVSPPMGITVAPPRVELLENDRVDTYTRRIQSILTPDAQIVVCIVPNNRKDRYDAIKKICCVENPVPSQVVVARTISKPPQLMSVATKIAIQMNCKLGGEPWALDVPVKGLMVCGFDSYHDSAKKGQSVGAFVASTNSTLTRYYSRCLFQSQMQELHDGLKVCFMAALRKYNELNETLPERVLIYRDGVGDGQLDQVKAYEIKQLTEAFGEVQKGYMPKFGVCVVKKRINTRLFLSNGDVRNPPPGTVVDDVVTRPNWYDFFIVSQSVRQGTVSPTHYNMIHDSLGLKPDHIQRLTYKLCHLYFNWNGTIRVPAPCQYAHKLAFLVGQSLHREPSHDLSDRLFYL